VFKISWKIILILGILLRVIYFLLVPQGQSPDEAFILKRVWANQNNPSTLIYPDSKNFYYPNNEYYYPPLYFVSAYVLTRILPVSQNPDYYSWFLKSVFILRTFSLFLSAITLFVFWKILNEVVSSQTVKLGSFVFISMLPSLATFSISANHNNLVFFLTSMFVYYLLSHRKRVNIRLFVISGGLFGLALLTKFDSIIFLPFVGYLFFAGKKKYNINWRLYLAFVVSFIACGGWWFIGELVKYGWYYNREMFASALSDYVSPFAFLGYSSVVILNAFKTFFATGGVFNNIFLSTKDYLLLFILTTVSFVGCVKLSIVSIRNEKKIHSIYLVFLSSFILNLFMFCYINFYLVFQPQGRYFFSSIVLLSVVWIGGIYSVFPTRLRNLMPLAIVSVFTYLNIMNFDCYARTYHKFNIVATNSVSCGGSYVPVTGIYSD